LRHPGRGGGFGATAGQGAEGKTGFLVPAGDATVLAGRVLDPLEDEGLRLQMGRQVVEDAAWWFGVERMVGECIAFYRADLEREDI